MIASTSRIGHILVQEGVVTPEILQEASVIQTRYPEDRICEILVDRLGVDHHQVFSRLARIYAFKEFKFEVDSIGDQGLRFIKETLDALPEEVRLKALETKVVPLKIIDQRKEMLMVVTSDATNRETTAIASRFGFRRPEIFYSQQHLIDGLIEKVYPPTNEFMEEVHEADDIFDLQEEQGENVDEDALDAEINKSKLTNLVEGSLVESVRQGASDIHIIPSEGNRTEFHFRIDGALRHWYTQEGARPEALSAVVKDRSRGIDRFERGTAQDGFIQREIDGHRIRYRVSVMPVAGSQPEREFESTVIRILDDRKVITDLNKLGLQSGSLSAFKEAISHPQGMVILTGPTGSGKSTTLNAALHYVIDPSLCVVTIEDPVEYIIPEARQIRISHKLTFDQAVRSILRHDPDIVMVGEMRDLETAQTAIKLSNTGHLTFSTLHTNDAPSAVSRLFKMGVEPFLIANAINIIVAQRLVRALCNDCKKPVDKLETEPFLYLRAGMTEEELADAKLYKAEGCFACSDTGYRGRMGVHEALLFTKELRRLIIESGDVVDEEGIRELAISQGMMTLRQSGLQRVAQGQTTIEEIISKTAAGG